MYSLSFVLRVMIGHNWGATAEADAIMQVAATEVALEVVSSHKSAVITKYSTTKQEPCTLTFCKFLYQQQLCTTAIVQSQLLVHDTLTSDYN